MLVWVLSVAAIGACDDAAEVGRIADQLAAVEAQLLARDVSDLDPALREERAANLARLRRYRLAGTFPRNTDHPGWCAPYFIDDGGRACAVGQLMIDGGYEALAHDIAERENYDLLSDIDHSMLAEWIARSGLTPLELALIQPCYHQASCESGDPCLVGQPSGCVCNWTHSPDGMNCSWHACMVAQCSNGTCEVLEPDCDDGDDCTIDRCDADAGCIHEDVCGDSSCAVGPRQGPAGHLLPLSAAALFLLRRRRSPQTS